MISIIVPALNEADNLRRSLQPLQPFRNKCLEIIVVNGGSSDNSVEVATPLADKVIHSERGRAKQMNLGVTHASGDLLLFLHADTVLPSPIEKTLKSIQDQPWGRFNVRLNDQRWVYKVISKMMNLRSCFTGIATGDQAIFVQKDLFQQLGGFAEIPLMEDIELSRRLRQQQRPKCISEPVVVSTRYWKKNGMMTAIVRMWIIRTAFFLGVPAEHLYPIYYRAD